MRVVNAFTKNVSQKVKQHVSRKFVYGLCGLTFTALSFASLVIFASTTAPYWILAALATGTLAIAFFIACSDPYKVPPRQTRVPSVVFRRP